MKIWAEHVGFATQTWKIGGLGFAIVRLLFGNRSLLFANRLLSFAIVRYRPLIVRYRSPIVRSRHLLFTNRSAIVCNRSPNSPFLFACGSLEFPFPLFSIRFSTTPQKCRFSEKKNPKDQLTQPQLQLNP